jgi:hypothetical protein
LANEAKTARSETIAIHAADLAISDSLFGARQQFNKISAAILLQWNFLSNAHKPTMFNRHPACVFGLGRSVHNSAEPVQIEIKDLVIALPFQVDTQNTWGNVFVFEFSKDGGLGALSYKANLLRILFFRMRIFALLLTDTLTCLTNSNRHRFFSCILRKPVSGTRKSTDFPIIELLGRRYGKAACDQTSR